MACGQRPRVASRERGLPARGKRAASTCARDRADAGGAMRAVAFALVAALVLAAAPAAKKAPSPRLSGAMDVAVDRDGSLLIGDQSDRVLRFRRGRLAVAARVVFPVEVAIHPRGGFAVLNDETRIRRVDGRGRVTTIARNLALVTALAYDRAG